MTPRKEIFTKVKNVLANIPALEYIGMYRKQFEAGMGEYPYSTACLIKMPAVEWETMVEHRQEGAATVEVLLYVKNRPIDQQPDHPEEEPLEINLIDQISDELIFLSGDQFKSLKQTSDKEVDTDINDMMVYSISFSSEIYKQVKYPYQLKKVTITT